MRNCPNCNFPNPDESAFCTNCGAPLNGQPAYQPTFVPNPYDHTGDFDEKDIKDNKLFAMCGYLFSVGGILLALLAAKDSPYTMFHVRQALKFAVLNLLITLAMGVLAFTFVVPAAGIVLLVMLLVVRFVAFVNVCKGKAIEPWLVRSMSFLN